MTNKSLNLFIAHHTTWPRLGSLALFKQNKHHNYVYLNLTSIIKSLALQIFQLWGGFMFVGFCFGIVCLFVCFSDLWFKLLMYSPTRQLEYPKTNVTVYSTTLDQNSKGTHSLCPQCFVV